MNQALLLWIVACVMFTLLEAFTQQFVSIWFLSGSVVALIASYLGFGIETQCILFVIVSLITLIAFRPVVKRFVQAEIVPTNIDSNIGQLAIVLTDFDEIKKEGRVLVNDMDWAAKSLDDFAYKKGERVIVDRIEGVKCLVRKA
jgi:membrane protein implicated in regulation of membrane protease activity